MRIHLQAGTMLTPSLRLERELGQGTMGWVWTATNVHLGTRVAVKVLRGAEDGRSRARFAEEARGLAQMQSPHLVRVLDFGVYRQHPFIVMELLEGEDLFHHIERRGALELHETAAIVRQICAALGAAHERGIVHRDIKPANVFLTRSDGALLVKVLDFGVAKFLDGRLGMTASGVLVGTPYYASPEQLTSPRDIDPRSDLWSVGVVTYACITARLPFLAPSLVALSIAISSGEAPPPSSIRPGLPRAVDAWMRRALSRDPRGRFQSAQDMADGLEIATRRLGTPGELPLSTVVMPPAPEPAPAKDGKTIPLEAIEWIKAPS
jgi:eukaryotic-like serine/threonine-protein kinase